MAALALVLVGGAVAVVGARARGPVDLSVAEPPAARLAALLDRTDLAVVARVVAVTPGRGISDPANPDRAVRTQLAQLTVDEVTVGPPTRRLVLEEVAALADGTPVTIEHVAPSRVGDAGLYLLVRGYDDRVALVGPQGRYLLDPDDPDRLLSPLPVDPLATRLAELGPRGLRRAVLDAATPRGEDASTPPG